MIYYDQLSVEFVVKGVIRVVETAMRGAVTSTPLVTRAGGRIATFHPEIHLSVPVVFSTAEAGNTSPKYGNGAIENRQAVLEEVGLLGKRVVTMIPQHGIGATFAPSDQDEVKYDILFTSRPGIVLELRSADCFPVILTGFSERGKQCIALVHAGREGLKQGVVQWGIEAFSKALYVSPQEMTMAVGPGICRMCYDGTDLFVQIRDQAYKAGLGGDIWRSNRCTKHGTEPSFPSHSRSLKTGEPEGRFMTLVWLPG